VFLASQIKAGYQMGLWLRGCIFISEQSKQLLRSCKGSAAIQYGLIAATVTGVAEASDTSIFESVSLLDQCSSEPLPSSGTMEGILLSRLCAVYDMANDFYSQLGGDDGSILPEVLQEYIARLKSEFDHISTAVFTLLDQITETLEDSVS
jgi:hypothetical protein